MGKKNTARKREKAEARLREGNFDERIVKHAVCGITCDSDKQARYLRRLTNCWRRDSEYERVLKSAMYEAITKFNESLKAAAYPKKKFNESLEEAIERLQINQMEFEDGGVEYDDDPAQWEYGDSDQSPVKWPESQKLRSLVGKSRMKFR